MNPPDFQYNLLSPIKELFHGTYKNKPLLTPSVEANQVHGDAIEIIEKAPEIPLTCDGLITQLKGVHLLIRHADCQALLLFDPKTKTIAAVHAGFRGLTKNIYGKTIDLLKTRFGCRPSDLLAAISPSLGSLNSEFVNFRTEFPEPLWKYQTKPTYFDLKAIAKDQLLSAGLLESHLQISPVDTYAETHLCHSYRRDKTPLRMHSTICLL